MMKSKIFELYASYVWPAVRPFASLTIRCQNCILNDRASKIVDGLCEECRSFNPTEPVKANDVSTNLQLEFDSRIRSLISNKPYDCIYLLSGGKDSAYVLYRLRSEYPNLKILALTVNNGFMSPFAIGNAEKAALKLNVDWILHSSRVELFKETLRQAFLNLNGRGCSGVVDHADGTLIFDTGMKVAFDRGIPAIISGLSWVQLQRIVGQEHFELNKHPGLSEIFPLGVWRTNEQEIRRSVRQWGMMSKGSDSPLISNSTLITSMGILDIKNLGYSSFEPEFAQLIREKKSDRTQWLRIFQLLEFAVQKGFLDRDLEKTLESLDLKWSDVCHVKRK